MLEESLPVSVLLGATLQSFRSARRIAYLEHKFKLSDLACTVATALTSPLVKPTYNTTE